MNANKDLVLRAIPSASDARRRLRVLTIGAVVAILAGCAAALVSNDSADWFAAAAIAAMFVVAENRDRVFADETGLSGSIAVALAASMYFAVDGWVFGAFLSCAVGGMYLPHIRQRSLTKIVLNAACFGLSALAAATVVVAVRELSGSSALLVAAAVGATALYWTINSCLLAIAIAAVTNRPVTEETSTLIRSDTVMLVFGFGGALCGIVMVEVGVWVGIAALVALLVALDVFVISVPAGLVDLRSVWPMVVTKGVSGGVAGTVSAVVTRAVSVSVLGAVAGLAAGVVAGGAVVAVVVAVRLYTRYGRVDGATVGGVVVVELVVPTIAAIAGAVGVVASIAAGFVVASALVVAVSVTVAVRRHRAASRAKVTDDDVLMAAVVEALADGLPARER